jgi:hypothetical protein
MARLSALVRRKIIFQLQRPSFQPCTATLSFALNATLIMDVTMTDGDSGRGNVQVHFVTSSPDIELPEGKRLLLVPTGTRRTLLNRALLIAGRCPQIWPFSDPKFRVYA